MKKKRNLMKRNSGFLIGCVLAAGASFVTADTLMERGIPLAQPQAKKTQTEQTGEISPETTKDKTYETDAFTVTASGNIIKGVETEAPKQTEKETEQETDENGNPVDASSEGAGDGSADGSGDDSYNGSSDGSSGDGSYDGSSDGGSGDGSYDGSSGSGSGDGSYDDGSSDWSDGPSIEINDPGNGDYYYTDGSGSSSGGSSDSGSSDGGASNEGASTPSDVILWDISSRYIGESELYNYSSEQLRLIRNEIFALNGRIFNSQDLRDYFSQKSWYVPTYAPEDFDANMFYYLNDYEEANLNVILNYEAALAGN